MMLPLAKLLWPFLKISALVLMCVTGDVAMAQYDSLFKSMYHICETIGSGALVYIHFRC